MWRRRRRRACVRTPRVLKTNTAAIVRVRTRIYTVNKDDGERRRIEKEEWKKKKNFPASRLLLPPPLVRNSHRNACVLASLGGGCSFIGHGTDRASPSPHGKPRGKKKPIARCAADSCEERACLTRRVVWRAPCDRFAFSLVHGCGGGVCTSEMLRRPRQGRVFAFSHLDQQHRRDVYRVDHITATNSEVPVTYFFIFFFPTFYLTQLCN